MTNTGVPLTPAGWYPDPSNSGRSRWWDGTQWTDTYADAAGQPQYAAIQEAATRAPEGTSPYTLFTWPLALLPILGLIFDVVHIAIGGIDADIENATSMSGSQFSVFDLVSGIAGWVVIILSIVLALLDYRALRDAGVPRPFHWAWSFFSIFSAPVYMIGRSVIVRRRTGSGLTPMFVNLGIIAASFIITVTVLTISTTAIIDSYTP